jgi:hypothetical protein
MMHEHLLLLIIIKMIFKYFKGQICLIIYLILRKFKLKLLGSYIIFVMEF